MDVRVKVSISKKPDIPIMGPGPLRLLEKIKEHSSINQAAKSMGLSYVKALNMLNRLEENLEHKILIRKRGGNDRGEQSLRRSLKNTLMNIESLKTKSTTFQSMSFRYF